MHHRTMHYGTVQAIYATLLCVRCPFSALTPLVGRQEEHPACKKTEWWVAGVVICLERGADLHTAQLMQTVKLCTNKILQFLTGGAG